MVDEMVTHSPKTPGILQVLVVDFKLGYMANLREMLHPLPIPIRPLTPTCLACSIVTDTCALHPQDNAESSLLLLGFSSKTVSRA
jgi:hypothetical protein